MFRHTTHWMRRFCTLVLCCTGLCLAAHAAPPLQRGDAAHPGAKLDTATKLDLRLPAPPEPEPAKPFARFGGVGSEMQSESLRVSAEQDRVGGVQAMVERFHREGLPVARLWQNHTALVSLGLNSKGKPGIWLVQKIN
jgi:hypothetical protein